jgi:hypothetical protein
MPARPNCPPVHALTGLAIILAYREDTTRLEEALRAEGFTVEVQRAVYDERELAYSRTIRCLLNHLAAWRRAAAHERCTLIVESDFVPCFGLGRAPAPFDPERHGPQAWAFLYGGGPRIIQAHADGTLEGHAACPVALLVMPAAAQLLVRFGEGELVRCDPAAHSMWDTIVQWWIMGWGGRCFLPRRHYGEHGGLANPEHGVARVGWASRLPLLRRLPAFNNHHAECLLAPLRFRPPYAGGSAVRFLFTRLIARLVGWGRLLTGRVAAPARELTARDRWRVYAAAFTRLL